MIRSSVIKKIASRQRLRIAVIGGGAGATEFVIRLFEAGAGELPVTFSIFEPRAELGCGVAWSTEPARLIVNMCMQALGPKHAELPLIEQILKSLGDDEAGAEYPTRAAVGRALRARWKAMQAEFSKEWSIEHFREEAVDLDWDGTAASILTAGGQRHPGYDVVVLALGNIKEQRPPVFASSDRYVHAWEPEAFARIPNDADVIIRGAGLSAFDSTSRLLHQGHQKSGGNIVWHSRGGHLPYVRPRHVTLAPQYLSYPFLEAYVRDLRREGRQLSLRDVFNLLELESRSAQQRKGLGVSRTSDFATFKVVVERFKDARRGEECLNHGIVGATSYSLWFSVARLLNEDTIPLLWNALCDRQKALFLQKYRREFDRYWTPLPVDSARRVLTWLEDGVVQLLKPGVEYSIDAATGHVEFQSTLEDPLGKRTKEQLQQRYSKGFEYFVDAGGMLTDLKKADNVLVQNLLAKEILVPLEICQIEFLNPLPDGQLRVSPDECHQLGAKVEWYSGAVLKADGTQHGWLFTLAGSLTAGVHRFTTSYEAVYASADRIAKNILSAAAA